MKLIVSFNFVLWSLLIIPIVSTIVFYLIQRKGFSDKYEPLSLKAKAGNLKGDYLKKNFSKKSFSNDINFTLEPSNRINGYNAGKTGYQELTEEEMNWMTNISD